MAIEKLSRVRVLVLDAFLEGVTKAIAERGFMQFHGVGDYAGGEAESLIPVEVGPLLSRLSALRKRSIELARTLDVKEETSYEKVEFLKDEGKFAEYEGRIAEIEKEEAAVAGRLAANDAERANLENVREKMRFLLEADFSVDDIRTFSFLQITYGRISSDNFPRLQNALQMQNVLIRKIQEADRYTYVFLFYPKSMSEAVAKILESLYFERYALPENISGRPAEVMEKIEFELERLEIEKRKAVLEREEIRHRHRRFLSAALLNLQSNHVVKELSRLFGRTGRVFMFSGWVPESNLQELSMDVFGVAGGLAVVLSEPAHEVKTKDGKPAAVPTLLRNRGIFKPFEAIVGMFGRPAYQETDPTPLLAISFVVMFGMMFGDIGQGAVLFAAAWLAKRKWPAVRSGAVILQCASVFSIVFGFLYGDCFGFKLTHPIWLDPMEDSMHFLKAAAVFGVFFMTVGFAINLRNMLKTRNMGELLFGKNGVAGIWFYWGTLLAFVVFGLKVSLIPVIVIWIVPVALMFFKEPLAHAIEKRDRLLPHGVSDFIVNSFFEMLDTLIGFISNTISFVRIAAFALNHAGLFSVVFLFTKMINPARFDTAIDVVIIVFGNLFIMLLEGFIVTIQVMRLEFYEFFGKFFWGTGTAFKPARLREEGF